MTRRPVLVLPLVLVSFSCAELGDPNVVTIGREKLSLRDLRREYAELAPTERVGLTTRSGRLALANAIVDRRLLTGYGRELAQERPDALAGLERQRDEVLVRRLLTLEGGERNLKAAELELAGAHLAEERLVERAWFATREAAEAARAAAERGATLERAAGEVRGLAGGAPQWVRGSVHPDAATDAIAGLPVGQLSEPFADGSRWYLARVLERRAAPDSTMSEREDEIARGIRARQVAERVEALTERVRERARLRLAEEGIALLLRRTEDAILHGEAGSLDRRWAVPRLAGEEGDAVVATWDGGNRWTAREYVEEIERWIPLQRPQLHLDAEIRAACSRALGTRFLVAEAKRRELESEWWTRRSLERLEDARYVEIALDRIDASTPNVAEADSVAELLHSSQPQLFHREPRVRIFRLEFADRPAAVAERERILAAGGGRARLAEILESRAAAAGVYRVLTVARSEVSDPEIAAALFDGPEETLIGPVEVSGLWVLLEAWSRLPARELTAEEVLSEVRQRMRRGSDRAAIEEWLVARRGQVGVVVDEQALDKIAPGV